MQFVKKQVTSATCKFLFKIIFSFSIKNYNKMVWYAIDATSLQEKLILALPVPLLEGANSHFANFAGNYSYALNCVALDSYKFLHRTWAVNLQKEIIAHLHLPNRKPVERDVGSSSAWWLPGSCASSVSRFTEHILICLQNVAWGVNVIS